MSTSKRLADSWEWQRQRAWELHHQGWWQKDIAAALGVSCAAVCQWIKRAHEKGVEALRTQPRPGGPAKLTVEQRAQIPALLARGAETYGFRGDVWTASRVAVVIWRTFGVRYHRDQVSRLLRQAGWSRQQPIERATQRDEQAIAQWYAERWPALQKKQLRKVPPSSGETKPVSTCCPWRCARGRRGGRRRSYTSPCPMTIWQRSVASRWTGASTCRRGKTPSTPKGSWASCACGTRKLRGKVLVIWDGSPIHKGQPIKDFLTRGAAKRLHLERLPGYAPDLNPDEGIWNLLKRVELKNRCCRDLAELNLELRRAKERLRYKRDLIQACSVHCGYSV